MRWSRWWTTTVSPGQQPDRRTPGARRLLCTAVYSCIPVYRPHPEPKKVPTLEIDIPETVADLQE